MLGLRLGGRGIVGFGRLFGSRVLGGSGRRRTRLRCAEGGFGGLGRLGL